MGFFQNLFGDAATDNISYEITENINGLLHPSSSSSDELWYMASMNLKAFYSWLIAIRDSSNIKEKTPKWIDLLTEQVEKFAVAPKTFEELTEREFKSLVTLSQVYVYCVQFNFIPLKNNMQHPTRKFYSKFIYDLYLKTFEKV